MHSTADKLAIQLINFQVPVAILGIGVSGSGKTTRLLEVLKLVEANYICPDNHFLRKELNDFSSEANTVVWDRAKLDIQGVFKLVHGW